MCALDAETTKIVLEHGQLQPAQSDTKELDLETIFDITDAGCAGKCDIFVQFQPIFTEPPSILLGLNYFSYSQSLGSEDRIRIAGHPEQVYDDLLYLHTQVLGSSKEEITGVEYRYAWVAIPSYKYPLLQVGTFSTMDNDHGSVNPNQTQKVITFNNPYVHQPPKVVVWLNAIDSNEEIKVCATCITKTSFTISISSTSLTSTSTQSKHCRVSWFAYPPDTPGICSGYLDSPMGIIRFDKPFRSKPRRILIGVTSFGAFHQEPSSPFLYRKFGVSYQAVSAKGMVVHVNYGGKGIAYIAME